MNEKQPATAFFFRLGVTIEWFRRNRPKKVAAALTFIHSIFSMRDNKVNLKITGKENDPKENEWSQIVLK